MEKRGATHIDWVVGMGIFIMYILLLLVWIKPGYKPVFEEGSLINIVKKHIEEDLSVEVGKTLLILDGCSAAGNKETITLSDFISGVTDDEFDVFKVLDGTRASYKGSATIGLYDSSLKNEYWVVWSNSFIDYGDYDPGGLLDGLPEDATCVASIGQTIMKKGLGSASLPGFNPSSRGFPESREIKILIDKDANGFDETEGDICHGKTGVIDPCSKLEPDSDVVFVSEWRYNILDRDHNYSPVLMTIQVW